MTVIEQAIQIIDAAIQEWEQETTVTSTNTESLRYAKTLQEEIRTNRKAWHQIKLAISTVGDIDV